MKISRLHLLWSLFLPIQIWLVQLAKDYPAEIEAYYSNGIYPYISSFFRITLGWIPFSVGDILIFISVFLIVRFLFILIKTLFKNFIGKLIKALGICSMVYFCFYIFWGLNYYREPLYKSLNYSKEKYSTEQLINTTEHIVNEINTIQFQITKNDTIIVVNNYEIDEMYDKSVEAYDKLKYKFLQFEYKYSAVKSSLMSTLQSYNGTSGYINPLTGEAQVNDKIPKNGIPTTICHEISHQIGYAAENEANFIGFLAANASDDLLFKYASYRMALSYCMREVRKRDRELSSEIWRTVNKGIIKDFNKSYEFWQEYKNPFEPIVKKGYNAYLKANNQDKGYESYNYVVDLLISYFENLEVS